MKVNPLIKNFDTATFVRQYLEQKGISNISEYFKADESYYDSPFDYPNMEEGIHLLSDNLKKRIGIICDCDCDGYCSAGIAYMFIKHLIHNPNLTVFFHNGKEHGIDSLLDKILEAKLDLLWVPDAGTSDAESCRILNENGCKVLITDHHLAANDNPYAVVINNQVEGLNQCLSGAGVTHKFILGFCQYHVMMPPQYEDLVALSIVSDICDIRTLENRAYLNIGCSHITNPLLDLMAEKLCKGEINLHTLAWSITPPINALCRGFQQDDKETFFNALVGEIAPEQGLKVARRAYKVQRETVDNITENIEGNLDLSHKAIVHLCNIQNPSYIGLVANKFCGKYHKPTILLRSTFQQKEGDEEERIYYSGSLRSPIPLAEALNESKLADARGHQEACGIFLDPNNYNALINWLDNLDLSTDPETEVACILNPEDVTIDACEMIEHYVNLWGQKVEEPVFYIKATVTPSDVCVFRKTSNTVKMRLFGADFMLFRATDEQAETLENGAEFEAICILKINEWNNIRTPQAIIQKIEITPVDDNWEDLL